MTKTDLANEIRNLPSGYNEFLETPMPSAPPMPQDIEEAQKQIGQCAAYITSILSAYAGLHLLKVPYYMGEGNKGILGLLLSSLEISPNYVDFEILEPVEELSYATGTNSITITIISGDVDNITCSVYPPSGAGFVLGDFTQEEQSYYAPISYDETGTYNLTLTVRFTSGAILSKDISALVE